MIQAWDFVDADVLWQRVRDEFLDMSLLQLGMSVRTINALYHQRRSVYFDAGINRFESDPIKTVRELIEYSEAELLREINFGRKSLQEVKEVLGYHGVALRDSTVPKVRTIYCPTDRYPATESSDGEARGS